MKGLLKFITVLLSVITLGSCTIISTSPKIHTTPTMTPYVQELYTEAVANFQNKDFQRAREKYETVLRAARLHGDEAGIGFALAGLGAAHQALQEFSLALDSIEKALPYFVKTNNRGAEGLAYAAMGEIYLQMDSPQKALSAFQQALSIGETLIGKASQEDKLAILSVRAKVFRQKAIAHEHLDQFKDSVQTYRRAAEDFQKLGKLEMAGLALWKAGDILRER